MEDLTVILNEIIVPSAIDKRIDSYAFETTRKVIIEKEKHLRNRVKYKTDKNAPWTKISTFEKNEEGTFIGSTKIVNAHKMPLCRGIMFSFYEKTWCTEYNKIIHLLEKKHERSTKKGFEFFKQYHHELGYLNRELKEVTFLIENN